MDHRHGFLYSLDEKLEHSKKKPAFLHPSNRWTSVLTVIENNKAQNQAWGPWTLRSVRKIKILSFLFGLTVTVLIMASYIMTRDQKRLFLTPSPYHLTVESHPAQVSLNLSFTADYTVVREVVRSIVAKVDFSHRRVPDLEQ
ncbi:hypothetical protein M9458_033925, partial [Cirrhinus mrigala]